MHTHLELLQLPDKSKFVLIDRTGTILVVLITSSHAFMP